MKILMIVLILLSTGCATTELTVGADDTVKWSSFSFLKNVEDVEVEWGSFSASIGSSVGDKETVDFIMRPFSVESYLLNQAHEATQEWDQYKQCMDEPTVGTVPVMMTEQQALEYMMQQRR